MGCAIYKNSEAFIKACVFLSIFTSSFDIFLNIDIWGYNIRFSQIAILPVIFMYFVSSVKRRKFSITIGAKWILAFAAIQFVFMFHSPNLANAIRYEIYLIFNIMMVFSISYYLNRAFSIKWLMNVYINSFFFVASFSLIQFLAFPFGINLLVRQWWTSSFARINGFSYEPSYFATFMLAGFIICAYLFEKNNKSITRYFLFKFFVISLSLILSTSRMGWLMVAIWVIYRIYKYLVKSLRTVGKKQFRKFIVFIIFFSVLLFIGIFYIIENASKFIFLLNGLGLSGTSAHSANTRIDGLNVCFNIWLESPFIGYSLGGVDPIISQYTETIYITGNNGAATSIVGELLVAGGVFGVIAFLGYIYTLLFKNRKKYDDELVNALSYGLLFQLFILCMNQNILRLYVWINIAILSCWYKNISAERSR